MPTGRGDGAVPTLHIEHPITDYDKWAAAFDGFAEARSGAGVRGHRVNRPVGDPNYIVIDLDFDSVDRAEAFLGFLKSQVWAIPENSPGLGGTPRTMILEAAPSK
jgi:hypothetical protein